MSALQQDEIARLERWCAGHTPTQFQDEMRIEMTTRGNSVTIWDVRAPWEPDVVEWSRLAVAQLRFDPEHLTWQMYWPNRNGRWLTYEGLPPTANFARVLKELDDDPYCCFWG